MQWLSANEKVSVELNANLVDAKSNIDDPNAGDTSTELATTKGYATFDLITNYHVNEKITVAAAINNLTDRQYWRWSDVNGFAKSDPLLATLAAPGINASLQLKYAW